LRRDVDLDELLAAPVLVALPAPGLALAVRQQPVEARADQHHHVGLRQHERARGRCAQLVRVGQQALSHGHRQVRDPRFLDQHLDVGVGLRVRRTLARMMSGFFAPRRRSSARFTASGAGIWRGRRVHDLDQRALRGRCVDVLCKELGWQIEVDAARAARRGRADGARHADADILACSTRKAALATGLAIASWSISS